MVDREAVWTEPSTWDAASLLTEDILNSELRNNLLFLREGVITIKTHPLGSLSNFTKANNTMAAISAGDEFTLTLNLPKAMNVFVGATFVLSNNTATTGRVRFDWLLGTNYISSGTATPSTFGSRVILLPVNANTQQTGIGEIPLGLLGPGSITLTLHWGSIVGTTTLHAGDYPVQLYARGL